MEKLKAIWEQEKTLIIAGGVLLIGPELLQGRGRPRKIMSLIQVAGLGILGWVFWKHRSSLFG